MVKKRILIPVSGGLGNQLFQLSAFLFLNKSRDEIYNLTKLDLPNLLGPNLSRRSLEIEDLILESETSSMSIINKFVLVSSFIKSNSYVLRESFPHDLVHAKVTSNTKILFSYFQHKEIVEESWPELIVRMSRSSLFSSLCASPLNRQITVHVRVGDYFSNKKTRRFHGLTDPIYYRQAVQELQASFGEQEIEVVSDNLTYARENLKKYSEFASAKFIKNVNALDDLKRIARSQFIVMSNSTFSWWGAWIGSTLHGAHVIQPFPWYANEKINTDSLIVGNWQQLKRKVL